MNIYVETFIAGSIDDLWEKTQNPELHQRWDLRFTEIQYLPRPDENAPQQFLYTTRIGFGKSISGMGETVGTRQNDHLRTSALKFWSDDPKSLIKTGSGFWRYEQLDDGVRFLTGYNYNTRFGRLGRYFDRLVFRPMIGWATAWSFDCLRLWVEQGIAPAISIQKSLIHALARFALIFIWFYQGLVPKLLTLNADEVALMSASGTPHDLISTSIRLLGLLEIIFALILVFTWNHRRILLLNIPLMMIALLGVLFTASSYLTAAFNPVTLNLSVIIFALIAYISSAHIPSASRCIRKEKIA